MHGSQRDALPTLTHARHVRQCSPSSPGDFISQSTSFLLRPDIVVTVRVFPAQDESMSLGIILTPSTFCTLLDQPIWPHAKE